MLNVKLSLCVVLHISICVHGENAKRILAYIENVRKETMRTMENVHKKNNAYNYKENALKESTRT